MASGTPMVPRMPMDTPRVSRWCPPRLQPIRFTAQRCSAADISGGSASDLGVSERRNAFLLAHNQFFHKRDFAMDLAIWLPSLLVLGLVGLGLMFAFISACDKV